ncbi:MAG: hypothetical protein U0U69_15335 [Acidimicrobiia bacterium]
MTAPAPAPAPAPALGLGLVPAPPPAGVAPTATRVAAARAARLRRPVAITARLFGFAAAAVVAGAVSAGAGLIVGFGAGGVAGPSAAVVAAVLYAVPLWLLWTCRKALLTFPRFLDGLVWVGPPAPGGGAGAGADRPRPRAPLRALHATGRLARGTTATVRAAAEMSGLARLASPVVSIGGAVSFVAAPALAFLGVMILGAALVLA